jgi:hypothetical protein
MVGQRDRVSASSLGVAAPTLSRAEAEEVLGAAASAQQADEDLLPVEVVIAAGGEVGISEAQVRNAVGALDRKREERAAAVAERRKWIRRGLVALAALAAVYVFLVTVRLMDLRKWDDAVRSARVQVHAALERADAMRAQSEAFQIKGTPVLREVYIELTGSQNRIAVRKRQYDEAVQKYNNSGPPPWFSSLPVRYPLSNEVTAW